MKTLAKLSLILCLCLSLLMGFACAEAPVEEAPAPGSDLLTSAFEGPLQWTYKEDAETGVGYYVAKAIYCANPVVAHDEAYQLLLIYAPASYMTEDADGAIVVNPEGSVVSSTGVVYTAETAPILYHNTSGGYVASELEDVNIGYISEGYVHVSVRTRGSTSTNDAGEFIGQFPGIVVDLKAGIRFLKANDAILPGNSERIISRGYSSGGAVSAMLGATGNFSLFESYLTEIGAADATDDIFIAMAPAPITNLSSADSSYEWYHAANETYWLFSNMAFDREGNSISDVFPTGPKNAYPLGSNILGGNHEDELSALLYDEYVQYVQELGFDLGDDGRSGEFYEGFVQLYSDALTEFIARYDEVKGVLANPNDTAEEYVAYLESLGDGEGWFTYDAETGTYTIDSLDALMTYYLSRNKMCPSLDSYNKKSNEAMAFAVADGTLKHFSPIVRDSLKILLDDTDTYSWTEDERAYIEVLYEDYESDITDEDAQMLEIMSPINYIVGKEGFEGATIAPYWRLRVGSADGDHGAPAAWLIAEGLKAHTTADVSVGIAWGMGHSLSELVEQDMYDYVAEIMVNVDSLPQE